MLDTRNNTGFYKGTDQDGRLIPTEEFKRSIVAHYQRNAIPFRTPEYWNTARAFDAATPARTDTRSARCHRALDRILDKLEQRRPARDSKRERRVDTQVAADAPLDDWGKPFPPDAAAQLREDAEASFLYGQREMGVSEPYGERAFAYRPGPARAADAGQGGDLEWMQSGAWASTGGVL